MKILLATDGSEFSDAAVGKCINLFCDLQGVVIKVVSIFEEAPILASEPFAVSPEYLRDMTEAAKSQATSFAEKAAAAIKERCGGVVVASEVMSGKPATRIVEHAESWNADVIIVGSHGRGFWGRLLGSVSNGVVNHAPCSVLVVRKD